MRFKIGNRFYEPRRGRPIMVILSAEDKINIAPMLEPDAKQDRYACFQKNDPAFPDHEARLKWMKDDPRGAS
jgi:hypothetical protein